MTGNELKAWKNKRGINQVELAQLLGITKACVSRWESEKRKIPPFLIYALKWLESQDVIIDKESKKTKRKRGERNGS
jgi:transcriptional regulator with XRE-family HTH domain